MQHDTQHDIKAENSTDGDENSPDRLLRLWFVFQRKSLAEMVGNFLMK